MADVVRERSFAPAQQGRTRALSVRLDDQAGHGAGIPEAGCRPQQTRPLSRRHKDWQSLLPMRRGPWVDGHASGDRTQLQHLFLDYRPEDRSWADDRNGSVPGLWPTFRSANPDPALWHHAEPEMASEKVQARMAGL